MRLEQPFAALPVERDALLESGASLVVPVEPAQRHPEAVEQQAFVRAVALVADQPERGLVVPERLGIPLALPFENPERVVERDFSGSVAERRRERQRGLKTRESRLPGEAARCRAVRAIPSSASSSPLASPSARRRDADGLPGFSRLGRGHQAFEDGGGAAHHLGLGLAIFQLRKQLRRLSDVRQCFRVPPEAEEHVSERSQRLGVSIRVAGALAQLDRPSIRPERVVDASLLEIDVRDRREVKGLWNGQEVCQRDFVASMQADEGVVEIPEGAMHVGQRVQRVQRASMDSGRGPVSPALPRGWSARSR